MKRAEAKIVENIKEDPASEPDQDPNTWLIEAELDQDILDWESARLDLRFSEIDAEIIESSMSEPNRFTVRTRGKSPLQKGDVIHVDVREQTES
jgi:hypothetical protein